MGAQWSPLVLTSPVSVMGVGLHCVVLPSACGGRGEP